MGRRKIIRTPEEEQNYQIQRRLRNAETLRLRREAARQISNDRRRNTPLEQDYLGKMNFLCMHCNAKHFESEKVAKKGLSFNDCCSHGAVVLESTPDFPNELSSLFEGTHSKSNNFFENIRYYNNSLSFASFNANLVNFQSQRPGPYCFKIHGQIYYQINTALYPYENENPAYGQLFFVDQEEALEFRLAQNPHLDHETVSMLDKIIRENNIFAQSYAMMKQEIDDQRLLMNAENEPELQLLFSLKPGTDRRRFNFQRTNEVAAIFSTTADGEIPESYVTIRNKSTKVLQCVSTMDPNVEPWIYPLFYPYGSPGWHRNLERIKLNDSDPNRRVTRLAYTKYKIAVRPDEFNPILLGRRLFQQWIVDSYVKVEKDRIQWCKDHQKEIKADTYQGLHDYLQNSANDIDGQVGKTVILPSTFLGSPRHMQQSYQDAMALVAKTGKPDIFLTMTCNPRWKEIQENLLPGQQACDRPDIVARVFHLKKNRLLDEVIKKKFFGEVASYVYVVEFQKRGLSHMHLLITLKNSYKITTPEMVNKFISAELPDKETDPILYDIVVRNMTHGPCGDWCMVDNKCSKKFPKCFQNETIMDENGYPHYQRRNDGSTHELPNGHVIDNRWVVPHCRRLLEMFDCHINVEIVSSVRAVKYLYKYIYKGHDAATVTIGNENTARNYINHDEVSNFIETRYVGPVEACYRILSKSLQDKSHTIERLPVHLPNQQCVIISNDINNFVGNLSQTSSKLLDYFKLNIENETARQYLYPDIPSFFTYKKEKVNGIMLSTLLSVLEIRTEHIYSAIDSTENCDNGEFQEIILPEYLNTLHPSSLPPYELRLRKNCIVMLIRNISIHEGLCNGTRLRVLDFSNHLLKCQVLTGDKSNNIVFLNRISLICANEYPFTFKRRQFPIKLAFAMTINKAQGQTFDNIAIDLRRDVLNHGQLYVAMSRVRSWNTLKIYLGNQERNSSNVKNYVYKELYS